MCLVTHTDKIQLEGGRCDKNDKFKDLDGKVSGSGYTHAQMQI
jgi:hypothetical protein